MAEPLGLCHLNGAVLPLAEARISPFDRSFLFGDGVYEVIPARAASLRRLDAHLTRLAHSLQALKIPNPHSAARWRALLGDLIGRNGGGDVYVYLQISRGAELGRNHAPPPQLVPTVFAFCAPLLPLSAEICTSGVACITAPDTRWARCDIKSVALLANVLLRQQATEAGASDAILLRAGALTEASGASVHVIRAGKILTPPASVQILPGTTGGLIGELSRQAQIPFERVAVSEATLRAADEIWLGAATRGVVPVTRLDGAAVGSGRPGPLWQRMHGLIEQYWAAPETAVP